MVAERNPLLTQEEYLAFERQSDTKHERLDNDTWPFTVYEGVASTLPLPSVGCTLALADIYHRVTFG